MSKDSSAKYYQNNKKILQKKVCERHFEATNLL